MQCRTVGDPIGEYAVPADAYYGVQTARAADNFPISGLRAQADLVTATILVKKAAAQANVALDRIDARIGNAIAQVADEVLAGALHDQFVVDVTQAGTGTSHNMNANEVLANRAAELLGGARGEYCHVHSNDDVNRGQSTNDVFPTATRVAHLLAHGGLAEAARALSALFASKADGFESVLTVARTHLQDAVPMTLEQEFGGYAACLARAADEVDHAALGLEELNVGATAVGTGLNAGEKYAALSPYPGYAQTAEIAKESVRTGRTIRDIVIERGLMDTRRLGQVLSAEQMTRPGIAAEVNP